MKISLVDKLSRPKAAILLTGMSVGYGMVLFGLGSYRSIQSHYHGRKLLEESFGFDRHDTSDQLFALGDHYRELYWKFQIWDYFNALLLALALCSILSFALTRLLSKGSPMRLLCLLPLVGFMAELVENTALIHLTLNFPEISSTAVGLASVATRLKLSIDIFCMALALLSLVAVAWQKLRS